MTTPVVTAEEFVAHVFVLMDSVTGDRPYQLTRGLWQSLRPLLGHPIAATGLPAEPPADAGDIPDEMVEEAVLAVAQSYTGDAQAVLRRRHDVLNLSVLCTGGPKAWHDFERQWDLVVGGVADSLLGEVRIYYGLVAAETSALSATPDLAASVGTRLPDVATAPGWERAGATTRTGFPIWELSPREDDRRLRRLMVLTPERRDVELSSWVWSDRSPTMPLFVRYLMHAAKLRHQVRVWNGGRGVTGLRARSADTVARLRAADPTLGRSLPRAEELDLASALTELAVLRRTVEIAADNMSRTLGDAVAADQGPTMFTEDKALAADVQVWLDDEAEYLRLDRDLLREARDIAAPPAGPVVAERSAEPAVALLTAMPIEFQAMRSLLEARQDAVASFDQARYVRAELPSLEPGRPHHVVLVQTGATGTNAAAEAATNVIRSYPTVSCLLMTGVAAGIPAAADPQRHVRLGDIVVATWGIVDYAHLVVRDSGLASLRATFPRPWPYLTRIADRLEADELTGRRPWERWLDTDDALFRRPPDNTDRLAVTSAAPLPRHPRRTSSGHRAGHPKIHKGLIGSADISLRDADIRDRLAAEHNLRAVEMEGAGIGTSAFLNDRHWFMVRGVSDYADRSFTARWRPYAALAAAAYVRALLAEASPFDRM